MTETYPRRQLRRQHRRTVGVFAALLATTLTCSSVATGCAAEKHKSVAHRPLTACELFDPQALAAETGWPLPRRGTAGSVVRDGLRMSSCFAEPERTTVDSTEGGYASFELSPTTVSAAQLKELGTATGDTAPSSLERGARDELAAHWLLGSDLDELRRLYGEEPVRVRLPRELAGHGAVAFMVPRHGAAAVLAGGRYVRIALVGDRVDAHLLGDVATDAARRLQEVRP